jgi:hypothetical protein
MRSNKVPPPGRAGPAFSKMGPMPVGPRNAIDRLHSHDRLESIARLRAAVRALDDIDVAGWDDSALTDHLDEISASLCAIDAQLSRVADAVRARGFPITEPIAA